MRATCATLMQGGGPLPLDEDALIHLIAAFPAYVAFSGGSAGFLGGAELYPEGSTEAAPSGWRKGSANSGEGS